MALRDELEKEIGRRIRGTAAGLAATTEGPVELSSDAGRALSEVIALRDTILVLADVIDERLNRLG